MIRLILVRHGETAWNAEKRYQGQTDVPLNETGQQQAAALGQRLAEEEIHAIYASDLQRAWETATVVAEPHGLPAHSEPRLREIDFGVWDGLTHAEIEQRYPQALAAWRANPLSVAPPEGENMGQVATRVRAALEDIASAHQEQTVLLAAHGGTLQVLLCLTLGLAPRARWQFRTSVASLSELRLYEDGAVLTRLNDSSHLYPTVTSS